MGHGGHERRLGREAVLDGADPPGQAREGDALGRKPRPGGRLTRAGADLETVAGLVRRGHDGLGRGIDRSVGGAIEHEPEEPGKQAAASIVSTITIVPAPIRGDPGTRGLRNGWHRDVPLRVDAPGSCLHERCGHAILRIAHKAGLSIESGRPVLPLPAFPIGKPVRITLPKHVPHGKKIPTLPRSCHQMPPADRSLPRSPSPPTSAPNGCWMTPSTF
jgi:hypothetical protein